MSTNLNSLSEISERGEEIYNERYRSEYEKQFYGKFVAINVLDLSATVGDTPTQTLANAKRDHPEGMFHLIRVGHLAAFEGGAAHRNVNSGRVHR